MTLVVQREILANQGIAQYVLVTLLFCATRLGRFCATWRGLKSDECLTCIIMMLLICLLFAATLKELTSYYDERKEEAHALDRQHVNSINAKLRALDTQIQTLEGQSHGNADAIDQLKKVLNELYRKLFNNPNQDRLLRDIQQFELDPQIMSNYKQMLKTVDELVKKQLGKKANFCIKGRFGLGYLLRFKNPQRYLEGDFIYLFEELLQKSDSAFDFYNCMLNKIDGEAALKFLALEMQVFRLTE